MTALKAAVLATAFCALSISAHAEDRDARFFHELDANNDGNISQEEFTLQKGVILYMLDKNHNLKIEREETRLSPEQFAQYAGKDGTLDGGDLFNLPAARFSAFDQNNDQKISLEEFRQQLARLRPGPQTAQER
jgi:hypothetical protein